jgi:1-acyl-sn-glycerol-3-phosphate acyltransferase
MNPLASLAFQLKRSSMSRVRPVSKRWLMDGFCWYARRMIRRSFHVFAVDLSTFDYPSLDKKIPLAIFSNHPGWWDPIVAMLLCQEHFKDRIFYAPIDAEALQKYRVFQKLGYFGIEANSRKGAGDFIDQASHILKSHHGSLWVTPEGRFTDVRDHSQPLMPGLAHVASRTPSLHCVPLAIEYVFSEERFPMLLCKLGNAITDAERKWTKLDWQNRFAEHLRSTQKSLAASVMDRRWDSFEVVVQSHHRPTGLYDWVRWSMMRATGKKPTLQHGHSFRREK